METWRPSRCVRLAIRYARLLTPPALKQLIRVPERVGRRRRSFICCRRASNRRRECVCVSHTRSFVLHFKAFISS